MCVTQCSVYGLLPGARKQSAAQRRRRVAEALNSCRIGAFDGAFDG